MRKVKEEKTSQEVRKNRNCQEEENGKTGRIVSHIITLYNWSAEKHHSFRWAATGEDHNHCTEKLKIGKKTIVFMEAKDNFILV